MKNIHFIIPLTPITKKNHSRIVVNQQTKKPFLIPSKEYKAYENDAQWFIPIPATPIDEPVSVKCLFYMPTKRACDLTNHLESIDDVMVKAGLLKDDNYRIIASHDGSRVYVDKENPRTEVYIEPYLEPTSNNMKKQ